jgi:hypothetical protein
MKLFKKKKKHVLFLYGLFTLALVVLGFFSVYLWISAMNDYKWANEYIYAKKDDWIVTNQANGRSNPFYIYSLFNRPVTLISMLNKKDSKIIQDNIVYVEDLWAKREIGIGSVKEENYAYLINCNTFESGWNSDYSNINKNNINLKSVKWLQKESKDSPEHYKNMCQLIITHEEVDPIIRQQKDLVAMYLNSIHSTRKRVDVLYDLMAPLGPFDPISKPEETKNARDLVNLLFGYYSAKFEIDSEIVPGYFATSPLRFADNFDETDYFKKSKNELNDIARVVERDTNISILASWKASIYRINNSFGDTERNFYWEVIEQNSPYYKYKIRNKNEKVESNYLLDQMKELGIQVLYKCEDKIIFIITGTSNNAFGYIYNAPSSKDINCGLLANRFSIVKDVAIDDKWRYWIAN